MNKLNAEDITHMNVTASSSCNEDTGDSDVGDLTEEKSDSLFVKNSNAVVNTLTIIPHKSIKSRKLKRTLETILDRDTNCIDFYSYRDSKNMDILSMDKEKSLEETNPELDKIKSDIQANESKNDVDGQTIDKALKDTQNNEFEEAVDGISKIRLTDDEPTEGERNLTDGLDKYNSEALCQDDIAQESDSAIEVFADACEYHDDASKDKDNKIKEDECLNCSDEETFSPEVEFSGRYNSDEVENYVENIDDVEDGEDDAGLDVKGKEDDREKGDGEDENQSEEEDNESLENNNNNIEKEETEDGEKLDDDEDRKKPQYVPKGKRYYAHDDRTTIPSDEEQGGLRSNAVEGEKSATPVKTTGRKSGNADKRWQHDKYNEKMQAPKTKEEIEESYGYEMRGEMSAPRGRRGRRYGRNQGPYVPTWKQSSNAHLGSSENFKTEYVRSSNYTIKSEILSEEPEVIRFTTVERSDFNRPGKPDEHFTKSRGNGSNRGRGRRNLVDSREYELVRPESDDVKSTEHSDKDFENSQQSHYRHGGKSRGYNNYREEGVNHQDPSNSQTFGARDNYKNIQEGPSGSGENVNQERLGGEKGVISRKPRFRVEKDRLEQESHHSQTELQEDQPARNIRYSSQSKRDLPETIINADTVIKSSGSGRNDARFSNSRSRGYYQRRNYVGQGDRGYHSGMWQKSGRGFPTSQQRGQSTRHYDQSKRKPKRGGIGYTGPTQASVSHVQMNTGTHDGVLPVVTQGQVYPEQPISYIAPYQIVRSTTHPTATASGPGLNYSPGPTGIRPPPVLTPIYPVSQIPSDIYRARIATPSAVYHRGVTRPPTLGPHPNAYQSHSGVTYYSTQSQLSQRFLPPKRVKTAIPILPPPVPDLEHESEQDASESDNKDY